MSKIFSEISTTGALPEKGELTDEAYKKHVLALALIDWVNVMSGARPPENFGSGMVAVSDFLEVSATPDSLMKLAEKMGT